MSWLIDYKSMFSYSFIVSMYKSTDTVGGCSFEQIAIVHSIHAVSHTNRRKSLIARCHGYNSEMPHILIHNENTLRNTVNKQNQSIDISF